MIVQFKKELGAAWTLIRENRGVLVVAGTTALVLTLARYHSFGDRWSVALVFYALLPVLTIVLFLRRNPLDFGLRPGNWRVWRYYVIITCVLALPVLFGASKIDSLATYYSVRDLDIGSYLLKTAVYLAGWEFLFRGYLLFGLKDRFKEASVFIQAVPFVLMHLGKPEFETISTIPVGIYLGYVAYRGGSCWPAVIIHIFINVIFRIFTNWL